MQFISEEHFMLIVDKFPGSLVKVINEDFPIFLSKEKKEVILNSCSRQTRMLVSVIFI